MNNPLEENEEDELLKILLRQTSQDSRGSTTVIQIDRNDEGKDDGKVPWKMEKHKGAFFSSPSKPSRRTRLHDAAEVGDSALIESLLSQNKEDVSRTDKSGQTPLHLAAKGSHRQCCQKLLDVSLKEIKVQDKTGNFPLLLSISSALSSFETTKLLISHGAKLNVKNRTKRTALHTAADSGNTDTLKLLLTRYKEGLEDIDSVKQTPLHLAAMHGHNQACFILVSSGANKEASDSKGYTPLHWAAKMGFLRCIKILIEANCNVNCRDQAGNTPLHLLCASEKNKPECSEELIIRGADLNARNAKGETPFHLANYSPFDVKQTFHNQHFDLQITDNKGRTALHFAAGRGKRDLSIEFILSMDETKNIDVRSLVNATDVDDNTALHVAVSRGAIDICRSLTRAGADGNISNREGSALHSAAGKGFTDICSLLIAKGVNVNVKNSQSLTPLHLAAKNGHTKCCELLAKRRAEISSTDSENNTVLHHAAEGCHEETCKLIIEIQPTLVNKFNISEKTPLHIAVEKKSLNCCRVLLTDKTNLWASQPLAIPSPVRLAHEIRAYEIFDYLLQKCQSDRKNTWQRDVNFYILMEEALQSKNREIVEIIIRSCFWEESFSSKENVSEKNENLKALAKTYPGLTEQVFNKCEPITPDKLAYIDQDSDESESKNLTWARNHMLSSIIDQNHLKLLTHPLVTYWINYKWQRYVRYGYWFNTFVAFVLAVLLTTFSSLAWDWTTIHEKYTLNQTTVCSPQKLLGPEVVDFLRSESVVPNNIAIAIAAVLISWFLLDCYKMLKLRSRMYFKLENIALILCGIFTFLFLVNFTACSKLTCVREDWQWILGALAVLTSWVLVISLINTAFNQRQLSKSLKSAAKSVFVVVFPAILWIFVIRSITPKGNSILHDILYTTIHLLSYFPSIIIIFLTIFYVILCMGLIKSFSEHEENENEVQALVKINLILDFEVLYPFLRRWLYTPKKLEREADHK